MKRVRAAALPRCRSITLAFPPHWARPISITSSPTRPSFRRPSANSMTNRLCGCRTATRPTIPGARSARHQQGRGRSSGRRVRVLQFQPELQGHARDLRILDENIAGKSEGSVLWLLETISVFDENARAEAERQGVAGERLIFAPAVPLAQHLARLKLADLFLDTLPYNAHTTGSDALWGRTAAADLARHDLPRPGRGQPAGGGESAGTGDGIRRRRSRRWPSNWPPTARSWPSCAPSWPRTAWTVRCSIRRDSPAILNPPSPPCGRRRKRGEAPKAFVVEKLS